MNQTSRARRIGVTAVLCSLLLRLWSDGYGDKFLNLITDPQAAAFFVYLETGRNVRFSPSLPAFSPDFIESPPAATLPPTEPSLPSFSDAQELELYYASAEKPDISALLSHPLVWDLRTDEPSVLIYHTHATESYTKLQESYRESAAWRTSDEAFNMVSIGDIVANILEANGIHTLHDRSLYDYPSYNGSYTRARKAINDYVSQYPSIQLILDLHRDAAGEGSHQMRTLSNIDGVPSAQLMLVVGTNYDSYCDNLSLALKIHAQLESQSPGITRPLQLRASRFNQDLSPGSLLVEVGAAGNTHPEAHLAAQQLAQAIVALAQGTS